MTHVEQQGLRSIVMSLLAEEQRRTAFDILDIYFRRAESISDFDTLGYLSLKAEYRDLYLSCAEAAYCRAETPEQKYLARNNLYKAYNVMNHPEKALFYIDLNLQMTPDDFESQTQRAFNLALMGDRTTSENILLDLCEKHPERSKDMQSALSGKMLRDGHTAQGILSFINTFKPSNRLFEESLKMKKWEGGAQPGRIIYVDGEGGIGDELINIRFFRYLEDYGMTPVLYSAWSKYRMDTVDLFRRHGYTVITDPYSIDQQALWTNMMGLPGYLNLSEKDLWYGPYLTALKDAKNLIPGKKFKIGIKCHGNPYFSQDEYRKIPLDQLVNCLPKTAEIYYIDRDKVDHPRLIDTADMIQTWEDTLDIIDQMDCIVSSCTSLVHAAGAMSKTTFVAVPIAEYYIWSTTSQTTRSPWYGENFQVHKQKKTRCWQEPLNNISKQLSKLVK